MKTNIWKLGMALIPVAFLLMWGLPVMAQEEMPSGASEEQNKYVIGAGDLIEVIVWKNEDLSGEFRVRPDGKFSMSLIGDVIASGKTTDEINMQVVSQLKKFIDSPYVSTIVREASSNRVYILGEVVTPGVYTIEGSLTVLQALALAGGFTEFAKRDRIVLVRGTGENQKNFNLNYREMLTTPGDKYNMPIQRGDTLVVR
jgi:polysaccharide export outer membrane protein